jgi:hypothetical protein
MKIALIGSAPSSIELGPYKDASYAKYAQGKVQAYPPTPHIEEEWEIWACSPGAYGVVERATRWFEVHRWEPGAPWFSPEYCQFLRNFKGPVYTGRKVDELPNSVVYPLEEVLAEFGPFFLTSSLSLMLAMAILEIDRSGHPKQDCTIGLWGVDMAATEEYGYQRAGCQHFIELAYDRGIGIYVPPESDLLRPMPVYGICEWDHNYIKATARMKELNGRVQQAQQQIEQLSGQVAFLRGAIDDQNYQVNTWSSPYGLVHDQVLRKEIFTPVEEVCIPAEGPHDLGISKAKNYIDPYDETYSLSYEVLK